MAIQSTAVNWASCPCSG